MTEPENEGRESLPRSAERPNAADRQRTGAVVCAILLSFLLIRIVGSLIPGFFAGILVSLLSVAFPGLLVLLIRGRNKVPLARTPDMRPPGRGGFANLLLLPPFLLLVVLFAYVSEFLAGFFGVTHPEVGGTVPEQFLTLALLPALTEEFLCRFLLLRVLTPYGKRTAVFLSALLFSLLHMNLAQIPYAFVAGLILGALAASSGSFRIPFLFHFVNNLFSLLFSALGTTFFLVTLAVLFVLSVAGAVCLAFLPREKTAFFFDLTDCLTPDRRSFAEVGRLLLSLLILPAVLCFLLALPI